ncbi:hypothetical protein V8E36_005380 [Tilletia maclaganii]
MNISSQLLIATCFLLIHTSALAAQSYRIRMSPPGEDLSDLPSSVSELVRLQAAFLQSLQWSEAEAWRLLNRGKGDTAAGHNYLVSLDRVTEEAQEEVQRIWRKILQLWSGGSDFHRT